MNLEGVTHFRASGDQATLDPLGCAGVCFSFYVLALFERRPDAWLQEVSALAGQAEGGTNRCDVPDWGRVITCTGADVKGYMSERNLKGLTLIPFEPSSLVTGAAQRRCSSKINQRCPGRLGSRPSAELSEE